MQPDQAVRRQARAPGDALRDRQRGVLRSPIAASASPATTTTCRRPTPSTRSSPPFKRDVAKAKKLLAEAGYPNGIDIEIACRPEPDWELLAVQTMVEQWKDAGIRVKINVMPSAQYWDVWTEGAVRLHDVGAPAARHHESGARLSHRRAVERVELLERRFDKLITQAEGNLDVAQRQAMMEKIERSCTTTARSSSRCGARCSPTTTSAPGLQDAPDRLHLRQPARDQRVDRRPRGGRDTLGGLDERPPSCSWGPLARRGPVAAGRADPRPSSRPPLSGVPYRPGGMSGARGARLLRRRSQGTVESAGRGAGDVGDEDPVTRGDRGASSTP